MKLSVILFTYNHEKYIAQALESVLMQQTSFPFEIIVLEDCSTDRTREILLSYQSRFPDRVQLRLAPQNECNNRAFIAALQSASSEYVAVLDGDDYWTSPHKLQTQVDLLDRHPESSLCFHNALRVFEDGSREPYAYNPPEQKKTSHLEDLFQCNFIAGCSAVLRRAPLVNDSRWQQSTIFGDWPLYLVAAHYGTIEYIPEIMGVYRVHRGGLWSGKSREKQLEDVLQCYQEFLRWLDAPYHPTLADRVFKISVQLAAERSRIPLGATVLVATHGDPALLYLEGRNTRDFPRDFPRNGRNHPGSPTNTALDGRDLVSELDEAHQAGAAFLMLPAPAWPWLESAHLLRERLDTRHRLFWQDSHCRIYSLNDSSH